MKFKVISAVDLTTFEAAITKALQAGLHLYGAMQIIAYPLPTPSPTPSPVPTTARFMFFQAMVKE